MQYGGLIGYRVARFLPVCPMIAFCQMREYSRRGIAGSALSSVLRVFLFRVSWGFPSCGNRAVWSVIYGDNFNSFFIINRSYLSQDVTIAGFLCVVEDL